MVKKLRKKDQHSFPKQGGSIGVFPKIHPICRRQSSLHINTNSYIQIQRKYLTELGAVLFQNTRPLPLITIRLSPENIVLKKEFLLTSLFWEKNFSWKYCFRKKIFSWKYCFGKKILLTSLFWEKNTSTELQTKSFKWTVSASGLNQTDEKDFSF